MLAIQLEPEIEKRLHLLAEKTGRSETSCACEAILKYIEEMEDLNIAIERLGNPDRRWTLEELEQNLDLEG